MTKNLFVTAAFALSLLGAAPASADNGVRIIVPARDIARGETIGLSDLTYRNIDAASVLSGTVTRMATLDGMQTRRVLHAGESVRDDDVRRPIIVTKGQAVTMSFSAPGITLTAQGRAMSEGGLGETVTIQNPVSFRMISATVTGAGAVAAVSTMTSASNTVAAK